MAAKLASRQKRGYGVAHFKLRDSWKKAIARGGVSCARCGRPIVPGMLWELDHDDRNRSIYLGPSHRKCNRRAGAQKLNAMKRERRVRRLSRKW